MDYGQGSIVMGLGWTHEDLFLFCCFSSRMGFMNLGRRPRGLSIRAGDDLEELLAGVKTTIKAGVG
jgi:hypothetical protein